MKYVWLLTTGSGQDGDEWNVESIHASLPGAELAKAEYERPQVRPDGSVFHHEAQIEVWEVKP